MGKLYYFQAPTLDINPESEAAPRLGSIFATLKSLVAPLNQYELVSPPPGLVNESRSADFEEATSSSLAATAALSATAAYGVAGSADVTYTFARDKANVYSCSMLETTSFEPTADYVSEAIRASLRVQNYISNAFVGRKHVYMVTGLKIATGLATSSVRATQHNPRLQVSADATALGVPLQGGPELDVSVAHERTVAHGRALNKIVFAYRVIRIKDRWDGSVKFKPKSGGLYGLDDGSDEDSEDDEGGGPKKDQWDLEPLEEDDIDTVFPDAVKVVFGATET